MCCDAPANDPAVGQAQAQQAATTEEGLKFAENYYNTTEAPLVAQETAASQQTQQQQQQMFGLNFSNATAASNLYNTKGLPAESQYYDTAAQYNSSDWQEQQAQSAMGDVTNAAQVSQANTNRALASRGVSANSGMALYNMAQTGNATTASAAAAANQARSAARTLGLNLETGAADMAAGGLGQSISAGGAASGNSIASFNAAAGAVSGGNTGESAINGAYSGAASQYGNMANTAMQGEISANQLAASSNAAFGQFAGAIGGGLAAKYGLSMFTGG